MITRRTRRRIIKTFEMCIGCINVLISRIVWQLNYYEKYPDDSVEIIKKPESEEEVDLFEDRLPEDTKEAITDGVCM